MKTRCTLLASLALSACAGSASQPAPAKAQPVVWVAPAGDATLEAEAGREALPPLPAELAGAWTGSLAEETVYRICMKVPVDPSELGSVVYFDGIECAGTIRYVGERARLYTFIERLSVGSVANGGDCLDTGRIEAKLNAEGSLLWSWFPIDSETAQVMGRLERVDSCP